MRISAAIFFVVLVGCSTAPVPRSEPRFRQIRIVSSEEAGQCRALSFAETHLNTGTSAPEASADGNQRTRRMAFDELERKVLDAGGNAIRLTTFREEESTDAPQVGFLRIDLAGEALSCP